MAVTPVIIDCKAAYAPCASVEDSLLMLPLEGGSVLDYLLTCFGPLHEGKVLVLPDWPASSRYKDGICSNRAAEVEVLGTEFAQSAFARLESSDYLFIIESRRWLESRLDLALVNRCVGEYRGASYGVAVGSDPERAAERIEIDAGGQVVRMQRSYAGKNWPEAAGDALVYAIVPAHAVSRVRFGSLPELRCQLAAAGVLGRDVPVPSDLLDLAEESAFLALSERVLVDAQSKNGIQGFTQRCPGVFVGPGCQIHPSVRLVPPVAIQAESSIEHGVTVVGPTVIGRGCRIRRRAVVARSVLRDQTDVPVGAVVRQRVIAGRNGSASSFPAQSEAAETSHPIGLLSRSTSNGKNGPSAQADEFGGKGRQIQLAVKRAIDAVLAASALAVLSPVLLVVAILLKLDSNGPVFFCHRREGRNGKEFPCVKFRTMVADAHSQQLKLYKDSLVDGPQFKIDRDPRVTRVGRWLRGTNLDELPQLFNVLAGQMSLVGPRPSPFRENQICVQWRRARLSVRPGVSGLWQICRDSDRSRGGFHEWIYYDLTYVRHFSLMLDVKIVAATVVSLAGRWQVPLRWLVPAASPRGYQPGFPVAASSLGT